MRLLDFVSDDVKLDSGPTVAWSDIHHLDQSHTRRNHSISVEINFWRRSGHFLFTVRRSFLTKEHFRRRRIDDSPRFRHRLHRFADLDASVHHRADLHCSTAVVLQNSSPVAFRFSNLAFSVTRMFLGRFCSAHSVANDFDGSRRVQNSNETRPTTNPPRVDDHHPADIRKQRPF